VLDELRRRVTLTAAALPSVCLYTFHHTAAALNCATVSSDAALVAGGFADSSVRVWDFDQRPAQPSGASAPCDAGCSNAAARRMSGQRRMTLSHRRIEDRVKKQASARLRDLAADSNPAAVRGRESPRTPHAESPAVMTVSHPCGALRPCAASEAAEAAPDKRLSASPSRAGSKGGAASVGGALNVAAQATHRFVGHSAPVYAVDVSPDGGYVLSPGRFPMTRGVLFANRAEALPSPGMPLEPL
jgi:WD40 repeat protein